MRQRRLWVLPEPPRPLSGAAAAVTRHQEPGQDGAQEEGHQHAGDQQGVVDVSTGALVHLRKMANTWRTQKKSHVIDMSVMSYAFHRQVEGSVAGTSIKVGREEKRRGDGDEDWT